MGPGKKLGLALGGGFLRGVAHIGVLKVLSSNGIVPDLVAGTSAGSIVAALYCRGWSISQLEELALKLKVQDIYDFGSTICNLGNMIIKALFDFLHLPAQFPPPLGLLSGDKLEKWMEHQLGTQTLKQAKKLAITSVDINTGMRIVFFDDDLPCSVLPDDLIFIKGVPLVQAVRASCSVPGLFEPKKIGIRSLVDGGLKENVPVEVLHLLGADVIIAVDLGYSEKPYKRIDNIVQVLIQSVDITGSHLTRCKLKQFADVVIQPVLKDVGPWDFTQIEYCIKKGEEAARQALPEILRMRK